MSLRSSDLWTWQGKINRVPYALVGLIGFAIKHNLDRLLAWRFGRPWGFFNYWIPLDVAARISQLSPAESRFLATMVAMSIPFIWIGLVLTLKRLRSAGLASWLAILFFVPVVNIFMCLLLCLWPPREASDFARMPASRNTQTWLDRLIPKSAVGSALMAVLLMAGAVLALTEFAATIMSQYGWGLFVALPFCLGLGSVLLYGYHEPRSLSSCMAVCLMAAAVVVLGLLAWAMEGLACIILVAPIALALTLLGGIFGYEIQHYARQSRDIRVTFSVVLLFAPAILGAEHLYPQAHTTFAVKTAIEINAPPEQVWRQVIAFTEIPEPHELLFRAGIAYPIRAEMIGSGVGAERHCIFSTGAFVEPIQIWDEPRLLKFSVTSNPPPMEEWTPYPRINPPHLHGFLVSNGGQFLLTPLPGGRTRLEGTTWYRHSMWPEFYWRVWSDYIIHRIHLRVLRHIRQQIIAEDGSVRTSFR
jgi:hypothetical protein